MGKVTRFTVALGAFLLLGLTAPAPAALFVLDTPAVPLPTDYPAAAKAQIKAALTRKGATFLEGHGLNSFTSLRYQGNTLALNLMIDDLSKCPGVTVHVGFKKRDSEADWMVGHSYHENRFQIEVNLNSTRVDVESLYIPPLKGPELKK